MNDGEEETKTTKKQKGKRSLVAMTNATTDDEL